MKGGVIPITADHKRLWTIIYHQTGQFEEMDKFLETYNLPTLDQKINRKSEQTKY